MQRVEELEYGEQEMTSSRRDMDSASSGGKENMRQVKEPSAESKSSDDKAR